MNSNDKIKSLKEVLHESLIWFEECKQKENLPEDDPKRIDDSYIYDECYKWFHCLSRGKCLAILEILASEGVE